MGRGGFVRVLEFWEVGININPTDKDGEDSPLVVRSRAQFWQAIIEIEAQNGRCLIYGQRDREYSRPKHRDHRLGTRRVGRRR